MPAMEQWEVESAVERRGESRLLDVRGVRCTPVLVDGSLIHEIQTKNLIAVMSFQREKLSRYMLEFAGASEIGPTSSPLVCVALYLPETSGQATQISLTQYHAGGASPDSLALRPASPSPVTKLFVVKCVIGNAAASNSSTPEDKLAAITLQHAGDSILVNGSTSHSSDFLSSLLNDGERTARLEEATTPLRTWQRKRRPTHDGSDLEDNNCPIQSAVSLASGSESIDNVISRAVRSYLRVNHEQRNHSCVISGANELHDNASVCIITGFVELECGTEFRTPDSRASTSNKSAERVHDPPIASYADARDIPSAVWDAFRSDRNTASAAVTALGSSHSSIARSDKSNSTGLPQNVSMFSATDSMLSAGLPGMGIGATVVSESGRLHSSAPADYSFNRHKALEMVECLRVYLSRLRAVVAEINLSAALTEPAPIPHVLQAARLKQAGCALLIYSQLEELPKVLETIAKSTFGDRKDDAGFNPDTMRCLLFQLGVIPILLEIICTVPITGNKDRECLEWAIQAVTNIGFNQMAQVGILNPELHTIPTLLARMRLDYDSAEIQLKIARCLTTLCYENSASQHEFLRLGGVTFAAQAIQRHVTHAFAIEKLLGLLMAVKDCLGFSESLLQSGAESAFRALETAEWIRSRGDSRSKRARECMATFFAIIGSQQAQYSSTSWLTAPPLPPGPLPRRDEPAPRAFGPPRHFGGYSGFGSHMGSTRAGASADGMHSWPRAQAGESSSIFSLSAHTGDSRVLPRF
jgi:hypothetical protein